ncbi:MarR family winged helix-turn-helix transcriptional regulator [Streptococcus gallolyticus]|uniref:MarR family winged helix-turn-helix transcriptional regulator n=1 Tax=Streptococcus gallolyticus TaxID=315405 RepID=UPI00087E43D1|nr:MarR family transcriptional regulator [Streptococcus gallolyticus]SDJ94638.1 DNA-binding transcriptional regulator, MarR family [Streptococcus gallolyticus]SDL44491.1 DNA-binding transcriptional regulator, MarR family [Streptococcus gallolyticus]
MHNNIQEYLDTCLVFSIKKLDRALDKFMEKYFQKLGLTPSYATILTILNKENGKVQKDIAELLCITPPTLTRLIEKLTYKGYVQIISEGRTKRIYLTDKAREIMPEIQKAFHESKQHLEKLIKNDNTNNLVVELNKITKNIH